MNDEKYCVFSSQAGTCTILKDVRCDGGKTDCGFFKTYEEYVLERNRAIKLNRAKGNCEKCIYVNMKCELIPEKPKI